MKNAILLFLLLFLFVGCHTAKIVTKQNSQQTIEKQNDVVTASTQQANTNQTTVTQQAQTVEKTIVTTNYDTSKPTVEQTGRPPIAQEVTIKEVTKIDASGKVTTETNIQASQSQIDKTEVKQQTKSTIVQKTTPVKSWVAYVWYILAVVILIALVIIIRYYWPRLKLFYDSVFHV